MKDDRAIEKGLVGRMTRVVGHEVAGILDAVRRVAHVMGAHGDDMADRDVVVAGVGDAKALLGGVTVE